MFRLKYKLIKNKDMKDIIFYCQIRGNRVIQRYRKADKGAQRQVKREPGSYRHTEREHVVLNDVSNQVRVKTAFKQLKHEYNRLSLTRNY